MNYEILVIAKEREGFYAKLGTVVCGFEKGHKWTSAEKAEHFTILNLTLEQKDFTEIMSGNWIYNFDKKKFFNIEDGDEFDSSIVFTESDMPRLPRRYKWASVLDPDWAKKEPSPCKFLHARHLPYDIHTPMGYVKTKMYWFNKFKKFKNLEGMKPVLAVSLFGEYGIIGQVTSQLPEATLQAWWDSDVFTEEDKVYMKWITNKDKTAYNKLCQHK
jgi:hypothetical protein